MSFWLLNMDRKRKFFSTILQVRVVGSLQHRDTAHPLQLSPFKRPMASPSDPASQLVFAPNVLHNQSLTSVKFLSSCFAGAVAGILGLENWHGFALFAASVLSTSFVIYAINCKGKPAKYLSGGLGELVNPGQDNTFTFILVWTLLYGVFYCWSGGGELWTNDALTGIVHGMTNAATCGS